MPDFSRYISLVIFLLSYVLFVFFPNRRMQIAVGGALLLLLLGVVSLFVENVATVLIIAPVALSLWLRCYDS